jgi:alanine racemase
MYKEQIPEFVEYEVTPFITRVEMAEAISRYGSKQSTKIDVHVKLDTGMGRLGFLPGEAVDQVKEIAKLPFINLAGVCSHLPKAYAQGEEAKNYTGQQIAKFKQITEEIEAAGIEIPIKHLANSAGILEYPDSQFDLVRSGIINYGIWPCEKEKFDRLSKELGLDFKPAMELKAEIAYTKTLPADHGISYGGEFVTSESTRIGVVPIGWADGYPRFLTHQGEVIIEDERTDILGIICMDQLMVDLSKFPEAGEGTEVLLVGKEELTAYEVAVTIGSIGYEIVTRIGSRVPRVYKKDGEIVKVKSRVKF